MARCKQATEFANGPDNIKQTKDTSLPTFPNQLFSSSLG